MSEAIKLQLPSSIKYLETIIDTAEVFFERNSVSSKLIGYLVASLTEAASNAIIHGNGNQIKKYVYVNIKIEDTQIRLSVEDSNDVFKDFVTDDNGPESLLSTSGRGIFIIKTYMDDVSVSKGKYGTKVMMKRGISKVQYEMKHFVLNTNVLLHDANSIFNFQQNTIYIPIDVLEELDRFKKDLSEKGRNTRKMIRDIDELRESGDLLNGVIVNDNSGKLCILIDFENSLPKGFEMNNPDNRIIMAAKYLRENNTDNATFVSMDINARVKAEEINWLL